MFYEPDKRIIARPLEEKEEEEEEERADVSFVFSNSINFQERNVDNRRCLKSRIFEFVTFIIFLNK